MIFHASGSLKGKTTVDNGSATPCRDQASLAAQRDLLMRMDDPSFREAVRLAARADGYIQGEETALEQLHRHRCIQETTCSGIVEAHNRASKTVQAKAAIIRI